ncbi:MAG: PilZ domain-containing protein [Proteobacteria bacterium]|nr:PilZ domain-containing protein [Pseudomonadota bacterium]
MDTQDNSEKRQGERVSFETKVFLKTSDKEIHVDGSSRDLSMRGLFVKTAEDFLMGTSCDIEIVLTGTVDNVVLKMKGTVVRKEPSGMALYFNSVDIDSYTHLKKLVQYNAKFPDNVI